MDQKVLSEARGRSLGQPSSRSEGPQSDPSDPTRESTGSEIASREIVHPSAHSSSSICSQRTISSLTRNIGIFVTYLTQSTTSCSNQFFGLPSIPHRFRSASHYVPYRYRWRSMIGHTDGSVLNDDSERLGRGSRIPAVRARSSSSQPAAVGCAAGRPG